MGKHRRPSLWQRLTGRDQPNLAVRTVTQVDLHTGITHLLTPDAVAAGRVRGGRYIALCGAEVIPAPIEPGENDCQLCHAAAIPTQITTDPMIYTVKCDNCPYVGRYIKRSTADERAGTHARKLRHRAVVTDGFQQTAHDHRHDQTSPEVQP